MRAHVVNNTDRPMTLLNRAYTEKFLCNATGYGLQSMCVRFFERSNALSR